jgi:two-component system chemotaxis response regulator CheY
MTLKVLAIDDSKTIRELLRSVMEEAGFDYTSAVDGVDGVERYAEVRPDIVITDINMPNMDGYGVIDAIRKGDIDNQVPILVLTTESGDKLKQRAGPRVDAGRRV